MPDGESALEKDGTGRRGQGTCLVRLALGVFGLFWVGVILYLASPAQ